MRIAIIDNDSMIHSLYSQMIHIETGALVDCYSDPLSFIAARTVNYDIVISDFYFDKVNLDFFWKHLDTKRLIILSGNHIENKDFKCLGVFKKSAVHSTGNIISLINILASAKRPGPSLHLAQPE